LPAHLIVLGGGYTGLKWRRPIAASGSRVTIIEPGPDHGREDADVAAEIGRFLVEKYRLP
jgi:pyruvate/2-oxoglutarate dehydrogenase complex dihydrolipoamide dehydrogenase (E3) component